MGTVVAVCAIGIGALGVAGTAYAASSGSTPTTHARAPRYGAPSTTTPGHGRSNGGPGHPGKRHRRGLGGVGAAIHGSFVVPAPGGGYRTVDTQVGTVTGVSSTSITVRSADGFTQSYAMTASTIVDAQRDGISSVRTGDEVGVLATQAGGTRTADRIVDRTQLRDSRAHLAPPAGPSITGPSGTA